jgi:uncharacterized membrane protein YhaH (DUF805 family)
MNLMFQPLRKYVEFDGRARRAEYWLFFLFNFVLGIVCGIIGGEDSVLPLLVMIGLLLPNIALGVRRLHDINLSGWFYLIAIIPIIGALFMLVVGLIPGTAGNNEYGEQPE